VELDCFPTNFVNFQPKFGICWRNVNFWFKLTNFYFFRKKFQNFDISNLKKKKRKEKGLKATHKEREIW
jgi:hypothetical protein